MTCPDFLALKSDVDLNKIKPAAYNYLALLPLTRSWVIAIRPRTERGYGLEKGLIP